MDDLSAITAFLGWCTVVNVAIYTLTAVALALFRGTIKELHSKLTAVPTERLDELYFSYLGNFKLAIVVLSLSPYVALKAMGG